jgi:hypothetical protein
MTVGAGGRELGLVPPARTSQQMGRQVEGRSASAMALPLGLLPATVGTAEATIWRCIRLSMPSASKLGPFEYSGRLTRGPPGRDSKSVES